MGIDEWCRYTAIAIEHGPARDRALHGAEAAGVNRPCERQAVGAGRCLGSTIAPPPALG